MLFITPKLYYFLYKLAKMIYSTLLSIMSNYTTITALQWPAQPRLLISFQLSSLLFLLPSNLSNSWTSSILNKVVASLLPLLSILILCLKLMVLL